MGGFGPRAARAMALGVAQGTPYTALIFSGPIRSRKEGPSLLAQQQQMRSQSFVTGSPGPVSALS